jgi:hypothetical protein
VWVGWEYAELADFKAGVGMDQLWGFGRKNARKPLKIGRFEDLRFVLIKLAKSVVCNLGRVVVR